MANMSPIEMARELAAQKGGQGGASYFKMNEGESKTLRFLTALIPMYQINHSCGAHLVDIKKMDFDEAEKNGQPFACPNCGEPLTRQDIVYERPCVQSFEIHNYIKGPDGKNRNFVCLSSDMNAMLDIVENVNGQHKYDCPICAASDKRPQTRCYGLAVEREVTTEMQTINGIQTPVVTGSRDVMTEPDENGNIHPKVVIVDMPYTRFWSQLMNFSEDFSQSISYYDWNISRTGSGTQTQYIIRCANESAPNGLDMSLYSEHMPDLHQILSNMGNAKRYIENGWPVNGYVPSPDEIQQQQAIGMEAAQQMIHQAAQQAPATQFVQQPGTFTPQTPSTIQPNITAQTPPMAQNNWNAIQNQLGQQ